jgi:membrane protein implicated in regulation of membrane protease activity
MTTADWFLLCFAFGFVWSMASLLFGSLRFHGHAHVGHIHQHGPLHHHAGGSAVQHIGHAGRSGWAPAWDFLNIHSIAIFLAWFGGCGYLMSRHTGLAFFAVILASVLAGLAASFAVVTLLRFLAARERVLDPFDYEMTGVVGYVSSPIREGRTGEMLFIRDGARKAACARSEDGRPLERGTEVVVTKYERGIAFVRTWDAFAAETEARAQKDLERGDGEAPRA